MDSSTTEKNKLAGDHSTDLVAVMGVADVEAPLPYEQEGEDTDALLEPAQEIITETIYKRKGQPIGIIWCCKKKKSITSRGEKEAVYVGKILKGKPAEQTSLRTGMKLLSLNGVDFSNTDPDEVAAFLGELSDGDLVIVASVEKKKDSSLTSAKKKLSPTSKKGYHYLPGPPPSVGDESGVWGTNTYHGPQTQCNGIVCCLLCGLIPATICCSIAHDKRPAYKTQTYVYDKDGNTIGRVGSTNFVEERYTGSVNEEEKYRAAMIAGGVGFFFAFLYLLIQLIAY